MSDTVYVDPAVAALAQPKGYNPNLFRPIDWDVFSLPHWRWERVLWLLDSPEGKVRRTTRRDDPWIRLGRSFFGQWRVGGEKRRDALERKIPGMVHAFKLWNSQGVDPNKRFVVEARILADQHPAQIAEEAKTDETVIRCYEKLFFDVRHHLHRLDWILTSVLLPAMDRFEVPDEDEEQQLFKTKVVVQPHFDSTLKFFAYFGGVLMLEIGMAGFERGNKPHTNDDVMEWLNESWARMGARRSLQAMQEFEINKYNVVDLFMVHGRIMEIQKSQEADEDKRTTMEKHIHAMLTEIPWTVGKHAQEVYSGTTLGEYDLMDAELKDEEIMRLTSGDLAGIEDVLAEVPEVRMPRLADRDMEVQNAGADSDAR